jgi:predicted dehydrogenase
MTPRVGVIGCGNISGVYLQNLKDAEEIEAIACADIVEDAAREKAGQFGIGKVYSPDELIADPDIDIVLNLTVPTAHAGLTLAAIRAGKHVYSEKPLGITREEGRQIVDAARESGVSIGCAPDTFLGAGYQTCRRLLDAGAVGEPVAATAFMVCRGHERWHPDPFFFYQPGGGPVLDMGPYYLTALVHLLGPVSSVTATSRITFPEREVTAPPNEGKKIPVEVQTHLTGALQFESGPVATLIMSFDVWENDLPQLRVYGTDGNLSAPDPNFFEGPVRVQKPWGQFEDVDLVEGRTDNARGLGLVTMACSLDGNGPNLASGELAFHVLDVMTALHESAETARQVTVESTCQRPEPFTVV